MTDYIPGFPLLALLAFLAGFIAVLAALALHDRRAFLLMIRDPEAFARQPHPAKDAAKKNTTEASPPCPDLAVAAE